MKPNGALTALCIFLTGCMQATSINSAPNGAKVWFNGQFVGVSPVEVSFSDMAASRPPKLQYRMERAGYEPIEGELQTRLSGGRVFGTIFTVGLLSVFRSPYVVKPRYDISMYPVGTNESDISDAWINSVRSLDRLHKEGLLSEDEFTRRRAILMRDAPRGTGERPDTY